jgi:hypothetical protein
VKRRGEKTRRRGRSNGRMSEERRGEEEKREE